MARGGARPGAGRPAGAVTKRTRDIADRAAATGILPHELLLAVVRGEEIDGIRPTFEQRLAAASIAAPYFAPKLASVAHQGAESGPIVVRVVSFRDKFELSD